MNAKTWQACQNCKAESSIHVKTTTSSDLGSKFCGRLISLVLFLLQLLMTIIVAVFSISSLQYTTYKIPKNNSHSFFPFVFNDIMGLEPKNGVLVDDVKLAMRGHMKEGYRFNPESKLSEYDKFYNDTPADNDKVHVLVCVIPADAISRMAEETVQKIRDIRKEASDLRIPQVVIITKIDDICHEISEDLKNVYKVQYVREKMEQFSVDVGIPMNCIFPVKNYKSEISLNNDTDILLLCALKNIINFGEDYVNFRKSQSEFRQK